MQRAFDRAAIINAITDAIGTEAVAMPATPPTVWAALQKVRHATPRVARDNGRLTSYMRTADGLPYSHISKQFPGKIDTITPYVIGKVVSRLEMDSRWALARSVRALVAERDALRGKLDGKFGLAHELSSL